MKSIQQIASSMYEAYCLQAGGLKNYRQMTNAQAREWLVKNDKEAASFWMEQPEEGLVESVGDNLRDFGDDTTGGWTAK